MGISEDFRCEKHRISASAKNFQDIISVDKQPSADIIGLSLETVQWQDSV